MLTLEQSSDVLCHCLCGGGGDVGGRRLPAELEGEPLLLDQVLDECGISIALGHITERGDGQRVLQQRTGVGEGGIEFRVVGLSKREPSLALSSSYGELWDTKVSIMS